MGEGLWKPGPCPSGSPPERAGAATLGTTLDLKTMSTRIALTPETLAWLATWTDVRGLTLSGTEFPRLLTRQGHQIFALTGSHDEALAMRRDAEMEPVLAAPEALPLDPCQFDVVFSHQSFHTMEPTATLSEVARVLRPGGCFSVSYVIRDDSVPWVRRLAALLRHYDPLAMKGEYGQESLDALRTSKYFPEVEERAFRVWRPFGMPELQTMVSRQPLIRSLDETQKNTLLRQIRELYESSVRPGERLRLPFQLLCCRAWVNHDELTASVTPPEAALNIQM